MSNKAKYSLLATLVAFSLAACGGSSSSDNPGNDGGTGGGSGGGGDAPVGLIEPAKDPGQASDQTYSYTLNGLVHYYGLVAGAEVCIDTTRDLQCDDDSPTAITAENGRFNLTVESPFAFPEHFILARFPADMDAANAADSALVNENGEIVLAARGHYNGHINPLTTLETRLYEASLSSFEQNERYAIGRLMISSNYFHSPNDAYHQLFSGETVMTMEALATGNDRVFPLLEEALAYTDDHLAALQAIFAGADSATMQARLMHLGYVGERQLLSSSQRVFAEDNFLTEGNLVHLTSSRQSFDVYNERADEIAWVTETTNGIRFNKGALSDFFRPVDQRCWHLQDNKWVNSNTNDNSYRLIEAISGESDAYRLISEATGVEHEVRFEVVETSGDMFNIALYPWLGLAELNDFDFPEELILVRNTVNESVCFNPNSQGLANATKLFSQMTGNEIVQATSPQLYQSGQFTVDSDYQRITLTQNGFQYDYRIMQLGGAELLMLHTAHAANGASYPNFYTIHNGRVQRANMNGVARLNQGLRQLAIILLEDATAVQLVDYLEEVAAD
ncbi:hypothetical protein [Aliidiomarina haloalkalitolerans]|uniref:Lipoprotein n=1 Tax=Aliidiomarina haloalkalitolerans TaxID=859059 RepID=A0A432VTQ4_9GAMM|nr:hypothetical protein [Aliidiomarina haloalkalitolerans]RUO19820.1 hypothetical protein CWE06_07225 [Aliidiomarina haloalkalitolerans]